MKLHTFTLTFFCLALFSSADAQFNLTGLFFFGDFDCSIDNEPSIASQKSGIREMFNNRKRQEEEQENIEVFVDGKCTLFSNLTQFNYVRIFSDYVYSEVNNETVVTDVILRIYTYSPTDSSCCGTPTLQEYSGEECLLVDGQQVSIGSAQNATQDEIDRQLATTILYKDSSCTQLSHYFSQNPFDRCFNDSVVPEVCVFHPETGLYHSDVPCDCIFPGEGSDCTFDFPPIIVGDSCISSSSSFSSSSSSSSSAVVSGTDSESDEESSETDVDSTDVDVTDVTITGTRVILRVGGTVTESSSKTFLEEMLGVENRVEINGLTFVLKRSGSTEIDFTITDPPGSSPSSAQLLQKLKDMIAANENGKFDGPVFLQEWNVATLQDSAPLSNSNTPAKTVKSGASSLLASAMLVAAVVLVAV